VRDNPRAGFVLLLLAFLALGLSWALWGQGSARAVQPYDVLFQSEIPTPTLTATFEPSLTLQPPGLPVVTATPTTFSPAPIQPTPTSGPLPLPTTAVPFFQATATPVFSTPLPAPSPTPTGPAPTAPGYLPPPTLTSNEPTPSPAPNDPALAIEPVSTPEASSGSSGFLGVNRGRLARLIDRVVVLFSYAWLCCGALTLSGVGLLLFWLIRRSRPKQSPPV